MDSKRKRGNRIRFLTSNKDVGWLVYSYALIGFLNGNETNVVMAILREVNESPDEVCEIKRDVLEKYTRQSKSEIKRNLQSLKNLGIIASRKTHGIAIRYFNHNALEVLFHIYQHGNKMSVYYLREEMDRLGIKSLLDVDKNLVQTVYSLSGVKDSHGSNMGHKTSENTFIQRTFKKSSITADELGVQYYMRKHKRQ